MGHDDHDHPGTGGHDHPGSDGGKPHEHAGPTDDSHASGHEHGHSHASDHEHGHSHASGHEHGHSHASGHQQAAPAGPRNVALRSGEGAGNVLFLDAFSGISGDMTIAALLDLGVPFDVLTEALGTLPVGGFHVHRGHVHRSGIVASTFRVHLEEEQPERTYGAIDAMLRDSTLPKGVKDLARAIFRVLGEAEADVHCMPLDDVHFHEVGGVDAIVDIVGAAACFQWIGAAVVASPLPMGRGFVRARHGVLPLPAPAVVRCLRDVPTYDAGIEAELVTPTGAAIVKTVASEYVRWPSIATLRAGFGGGQRELEDRPNLLRAVLGKSTGAVQHESDTHVVLEANVDDMTGELVAHAIDVALREGALDAWATPITMKKGRPAFQLGVLVTGDCADRLSHALLRETTTLGVRRARVSRVERPRRTIEVSTPFGRVPVKVSEGDFGPPQIKPEFDACVRVARESGVPVREVIALALSAARQAVGLG